MPQISEYSRRNLASSVVGTPGADYSTGQALDSVSRNTKAMAGASFDLAVKRKAAMDANLVNEYALKAASEEEAAFNQFNQDQRSFIGTPQERVAMYDKTMSERSKARLSTVANNQEVFARASQHEADIRLRNSQRQFQVASNNQVDLAVASMMNFQKQAETEASRIGADTSLTFEEKRKQVDWILGNVNESMKATSMVLSPDKAAQLQAQKPAAILTAMAMGMLSKDPAQLNLFLNEKGKDGQTAFERAGMAPDDIEKMRALTQQAITAFDTRRQRDEYIANSQQLSEIDNHIINGNDAEAFALIQSLPEGKLKADMFKTVVQRHLPVNDKADRVWDLMQEYAALVSDMGAHTSKEDKKAGVYKINAPLARMIAFQEKVAEANALGYLDKGTYMKYVTKLLPAMQQKARGVSNSDVGFPNAGMLGLGWQAVSKIFKTDKGAAVGVYKDVLARLDQSKDTSEAAFSTALRDALSHHVKERFPSMLGLSGTPNAVLTANKEVVATGIQGASDMPVSGKIKNTGVRYEMRPQIDRNTGQPTGKMFRVGYDENNKPISKEEVNV